MHYEESRPTYLPAFAAVKIAKSATNSRNMLLKMVYSKIAALIYGRERIAFLDDAAVPAAINGVHLFQ